ncbi:MAG TPA: TetR family transcriptional regulator [Diaminobutyricibacter sp.]
MDSGSESLDVAFIRARRPEQKEQRYTAILDAARQLALRDGVGSVSLATIAASIGMHKSALLNYFATREEIFLRIAETEWQSWADAVVAELNGGSTDDAELVTVLTRSLTDRPLFCQLLTYSALTLERNVPLDALRRSKSAAFDAAGRVADALHASLPTLTREACLELVTMTSVTAAGLWQIAHPPPAVVALHEESELRADGGPGPIRFDDRVGRFIRIYLEGLRHSS